MIRLLTQALKASIVRTNISPLVRTSSSWMSNTFSAPINGTKLPINLPVRPMFIYRSGDMLWEGVTGPPGRAKKRARGKRRVIRNKVDLNFGRKIGENVMNYKWPGLNAPVLVDNKISQRSVAEADDDYMKLIIDKRNKMNKKKYNRSLPPLKRGWSGSSMGGQSLGRPEPVIGQDWTGFDSRVLEFKVVSTMSASKGRLGRYSATVMVGNGNGLAGIGKAKSTDFRSALKVAKRRATTRFEFFELRDSRTLWHPDFVHDWSTNLFVKPLSEGRGLVCHRLIRTMCELIGIKDMYAKVEGSVKNYQVIARAFAAILRKQETYQDIANRLSLNVVEFRSESDNYPKLLAAPSSGLTKSPGPDDIVDFDRLHLGGRVFWSKKYRPFYLDFPGPQKYRYSRHRYRNQTEAERNRAVMQLLADEGHLLRQPLGEQQDRAEAISAAATEPRDDGQ